MRDELIEVSFVDDDAGAGPQLDELAAILEREGSVAVTRIRSDDARGKASPETVQLVLTALSTAISAWGALVTTLQWWGARKRSYSVRLEVPGEHIDITNLSSEEAMALLAKHGQTSPARVQLKAE